MKKDGNQTHSSKLYINLLENRGKVPGGTVIHWQLGQTNYNTSLNLLFLNTMYNTVLL